MQMSRHSQLRNAVCVDLCTVWKKDCASRHAALVSGMKFRVRSKKTHWERDFYAIIMFQRKHNFAESRSSRRSLPVCSDPFFHFLFCSLFSLSDEKKISVHRIAIFYFKNFKALVTICHLLLDHIVLRSSIFSRCSSFENIWGVLIQDSFVRILFLSQRSSCRIFPYWWNTCLDPERNGSESCTISIGSS